MKEMQFPRQLFDVTNIYDTHGSSKRAASEGVGKLQMNGRGRERNSVRGGCKGGSALAKMRNVL